MRAAPRPSRSIAARLSWMNLLVSGIALLLAYFSYVAYDLVNARQAAIDHLTGEAQIICTNSVSAILLGDPAVAQSTLSSLGSSPDVTGAAIYTSSGDIFARYIRPGSGQFLPITLPRGVDHASWRNGIDVVVAVRMVSRGQPVGVVYIQAHLKNLGQHALRYAIITAAILLLCLLVALLIGGVFRRLLSRPIVSLARTARLISRYRDYSLRFEPTQRYSELQSLTDAFNEMLGEIQQRDAALEQARDQLELRVEERTAQLVAANHEMEAFSYTVAHDLRGPLEIISNICYLLQNSSPSPDPVESQSVHQVPNQIPNQIPDQVPDHPTDGPMLDRLASSVAQMSNIIDDLLNLSRATSAGLHCKPIDLSAVAVAILDDLAATYPARDVKTSVQLGCHANADKGLMHIVLQNLLRNAWKFTSRTSAAHVEVGCRREGPEPVFFVRDNGAGFDQRQASRLFKPFQRLHAESDFSGTGIGLATVERVIERHGGSIWAEGEVGRGASFYFTLGSPDA